jgi:hypothetical protein
VSTSTCLRFVFVRPSPSTQGDRDSCFTVESSNTRNKASMCAQTWEFIHWRSMVPYPMSIQGLQRPQCNTALCSGRAATGPIGYPEPGTTGLGRPLG